MLNKLFPRADSGSFPANEPLPAFDRTAPRDILDLNDPVLGHIETFRLPNEISVTFIPRRNVPLITLYATIDKGSFGETPEQSGIAHFLEHMVFEGTRAYPSAAEVKLALEAHEARTNAATSRVSTSYHIQLPNHEMEFGLRFLQQLVFEPLLSSDAIEHQKGIIRSELAGRRLHEVDSLIAKMFPETGTDRLILGTKASIDAMTREWLDTFHKSHYAPRRLSLYVVGDIPSDGERKVADIFGGHENHGPSLATTSGSATLPASNPTNIIDFWDREKTDIHFIFELPAQSSADVLNGRLLGNVLEESVYERLREKMGAVYASMVNVNSLYDRRWIEVTTDVPRERSMEMVRALGAVFQSATENPLSDEGRLRTLALTKMRMLHQFLDPLAAAENLAKLRFSLPFLNTPGEYIRQLGTQSSEQLLAYSARVFSASPGVIMKGGADQAFFERAYSEMIGQQLRFKE